MSDPRSDEELVHATREGDLHAFDVLYRRYDARLFGYLLRATRGQRSRAEDLAHDVFLRVLEDRSFDPARGRFAPWLFTVARNAARARARKQRGRERILSGGGPVAVDGPQPVADSLDETVDRKRCVRLAMAGLSEAHQQVLVLKQLGGLSYRELASTLDIAEGTAKSRLHAAMRAFRAGLRALESTEASTAESHRQGTPGPAAVTGEPKP